MVPRDDATVRLPTGRSSGSSGRRWIVGLVVLVLVAAGAGAGWWWELRPPPGPPPIPIRTADEPGIRDNHPADIDVFRFAANPHILVLDFADLHRQGAMFNRLALMSEKIGEPHDRALDDGELDRAIRAGGDTPDTVYYGHDYGTDELVRFFAAVDREKLPLTPEESWLR